MVHLTPRYDDIIGGITLVSLITDSEIFNKSTVMTLWIAILSIRCHLNIIYGLYKTNRQVTLVQLKTVSCSINET